MAAKTDAEMKQETKSGLDTSWWSSPFGIPKTEEEKQLEASARAVATKAASDAALQKKQAKADAAAEAAEVEKEQLRTHQQKIKELGIGESDADKAILSQYENALTISANCKQKMKALQDKIDLVNKELKMTPSTTCKV